jgi:hypothetical protein
MNSLGVKDHTMLWEVNERNQHCGGNESIDIAKSQILGKEGNTRIIKVSPILLRGCLIPIINTTFIELTTTTNLFTLSLLVSS